MCNNYASILKNLQWFYVCSIIKVLIMNTLVTCKHFNTSRYGFILGNSNNFMSVVLFINPSINIFKPLLLLNFLFYLFFWIFFILNSNHAEKYMCTYWWQLFAYLSVCLDFEWAIMKVRCSNSYNFFAI